MKQGLEYRRALWLVGLEEEVTVVKTPLSVYALRADGTRASYARVLDEDARAYRDRFGAGSPGLEERLEQTPADERLPVSIQVVVPMLESILASPDDGRAERLEQAIEAAEEAVAGTLVEHEFVESRRSPSMPVLFGTIPAGAIPGIVHDDRLALVAIDEILARHGDGEYATDPVAEHSIDATWNPTPADYAKGVPVGMIEWCAFDPDIVRGIYDQHVAFHHASVTYTAAPTNPESCTTDADCADTVTENGCSENQVRCRDSRCVARHASEVASVISATKPGDPPAASGAAKVDLVVANNAKPDTGAGYDKLYEGLKNAGVKTVNETHEGIHAYGGPQVADWYARAWGILPVQAGGAAAVYGDQACPQSANAICVGASRSGSAHQLASQSPTTNPPAFPDREEPDVIAFGGDFTVGDEVQLLGFNDTNDWSGADDGTSFAAPSVTSMIAHFRKACAPYFGTNIDHRFLRAVVRTSAWAGNPDGGQRYSTPAPFADWLDGAGWVDAPALDWWCQTGSQGVGGTTTIDLFGGDDPDPGTTDGYDPGGPAPQSRPMDFTPPSQASRKEYLLANMWLDVGDRIRFTISWDVCATGALDTPSAAVGVDLDLLLYNSTTKTYVYGSQSVADNNEGWDVTIGPGQKRGRYEVYISKPAGDKYDCGSSSDPVVGYAGRWGQW